ncbi:PBCV-specific basic adaptor domain-containing protein [Paramecium bursaria Chlorella virus NE-JV-1]|nr:PBCV-specific basic adaptor domain-containing protein [Paramecium bursaria Chlorella virus NE-JV-1]
MDNSIPTGTVNAKKRPVFKDSKGRTFVKEGSKKVYVKKLFMPTTIVAKSPVADTGKIDAKQRRVFVDTKKRTYVKQGDKKVYVKKLFTPKADMSVVVATSPTADTGKVNAKKRRVFVDTKKRTYVKQGDKKVYVKKLFTPKVSPVIVRPTERTRKAPAPKKIVDWRSMVPERFFCASRGLGQKTSTCWFNSALNGLVLSSATSKMILEDMRKLTKRQIAELSNMNISDSCPKELSKKFVYAYALKIHDEFLQNRDKNESKNLVDKMFTPGKLSSPVARGEKGHFAIDAIHQLLRRVFPNAKQRAIGMLEEAKRISSDTTFVIFDTILKKPSEIPTYIGEDFKLSHLVYILEKDSGLHAVVAYNCDRERSVYDSNNRTKLDVNWSVKNNEKALLAYSNAKNIHSIAYALYVKE